MKYSVTIAAALLLGSLGLSGCSNNAQQRTAQPPPQASPAVLAKQTAVRAQAEQNALAAMREHMHMSGPPAPGGTQ